MTHKSIKKHPKTVTITLNDLSRALTQRWSVNTCVLAQSERRTGASLWDIHDSSTKAQAVMKLFDNAHGKHRDKFPPDRRLIAKVKAMLPIKVKP